MWDAGTNMLKQSLGCYRQMTRLDINENISPAVRVSCSPIITVHNNADCQVTLYTISQIPAAVSFNLRTEECIQCMNMYIQYFYLYRIFPMVVVLNSFNNTVNF